MTRTAVVILNYNGAQLLRTFLPSVIQFSPHAEVIVADNGSTDSSRDVLEKEFPRVRCIRLDANYGFCGGYNRALRQVDAEYFLLLNSDVEVTSGWLTSLENLLIHRSDIDAVQPKILSYRDKTRFEYAGAAGGFIDRLGYPFCRGRMFTEVEEDKGQYDDEREIFWATGACFLIRAKAFREAGGFDEDFFAHMEEIDVCWKIHRTGRKVFYCGKSQVYHKGAGTLGYDSPMKTYLNFRNGLFLILKHFNTAELLYKLPARLLLDWAAALVFLLRGKTRNAAGVLKAHVHFIRQFRRTLRKRKAIRRAHPSYDRAVIYPGLIVVDFYLRRKPRYQ